jgi:PglZ domain
MHPLHDYLCQQLGDMLKKRGVVVFYDPRREFVPFFDRELQEAGKADNKLPQVFIGKSLIFLARYVGSFFGLRAFIEPIISQDNPEAIVVYVPGVTRDRQASVLMELEKGGTCYEPQLKRLALNVLRKRFTDGQIDELLRPASVGYEDIVSFLRQGEEGTSASVLRTLFGGVQSEELLTQWLAHDDTDQAIVDKEAAHELFTLIETRLGLVMPGGIAVTEARDKALRYVLVGEFRSDLVCEPPASISMVPIPPSKEQLDRVREIADGLRRRFANRYVELADRVEQELSLRDARIDAAHLGNIDTFRFEEILLLAYTGELIAARKYDQALNIVTGQSRSFWVDQAVSRQAQWEACRLMAELGREGDCVGPQVAKMGTDPAKWLAAYTDDRGWHQVDSLQRRLETWVAKMDDEPEAEKALAVVRREYEELLKRMAEGFTRALQASAWSIPSVLHQTRIYPDVVQVMGGRVAYFFVDAMRLEMGIELAKQLQDGQDLMVRPAIAALPSITPVGMAALLPGASASFSVVDHKGKLATSIEGTAMPGLTERLKFLKAKVPGVVELTLGKLLSTPTPRLGKSFSNATLVVVRSQEIDFMGEMDADLLARQVMDTIIGNLARAVKKLATVGIEHFVITADHGHQFSIRKDEDMRTDHPSGDTVDVHRRCWIGRGGSTPPGTVRVSGAELGYQTDLDFVFPTGLGVLKAGGGLSVHHGGCSLQELVVPVVSLRMPARRATAPAGQRVHLAGVPDALTNRTFGVRVSVVAELFSADPVSVRVILVSGSEVVGQAGMAVGAEFDRATGVLRVTPGTEASVGLMLTRDDCQRVRVVVQDPASDAVLGQSDEIPAKLGI